MKLQFTKMNGCGNDFIVFPFSLEDKITHPEKKIEQFCRRSFGIGADGVLTIEPSSKADYKMHIFNSDGQEAGMCGNGLRCAVRYAHQYLKLPNEGGSFETRAGIYNVWLNQDDVKIQMVPPSEIKVYPINGESFHINTGVPHLVTFVSNLQDINIQEEGSKLRFHETFQPEGVNVNFVEVIDTNTLKIRTYERGVEHETFACGTGATAAALVYQNQNKLTGTTKVNTVGGILSISTQLNQKQEQEVFMEGDAQIVYEGEIYV